MAELIILPNNTNQFEANGTFTFEESLSVDRYRMFEQLKKEAGFGLSFEELVGVLDKNIEFIERFVQGEKVYTELAILNYNARKGIVDMSVKEPYCVWLCTLFFNEKEEDRRWFDKEVMLSKIKRWKEAGIDTRFFINRACALISNYSRLYAEITQMSSLHDEMPDQGEMTQEGLPPVSE